MRGLRKLSVQTVSCYTNLSCSIIFTIWALCAGDDLIYFKAFTGLDWLALTSTSVLLVFAQNFYFMTLQNLPAPAVQPLSFMGLIYQFLFDLILFGMAPNAI